jgi:hypothetical protein
MAATRWLGLSVIVGAGAFIGSVALPAMIGKPPILDPRFSLGFFVIIYVGMAVGLRRHKLFELDQWAFRILFYLGAGAALLVLDACCWPDCGTAPQASLGAALLIVAFAYLPFRDVLWRRTVAADHEGPRDVRRRRPGRPDPPGRGPRRRVARPAGQDL